MIGLDTNVVIASINGRPTSVRDRLKTEIVTGTVIGIPAVVLFEMHYGAAKSTRRAQSEAALAAFLTLTVTPWPFDQDDATHAAEIRAVLERQGRPIGWYDYLIAAQARRRGAVLVTANRSEFDRVPGLNVTDWSNA